MNKPILCLDFDGVIHSYVSGWRGATIIPDQPVPGAIQFLVEAQEHFKVMIYSSRSGQEGGIKAMKTWLEVCALEVRGMATPTGEHPGTVDWLDNIGWPTNKPAAFLSIDDRCLLFTGKFPDPDILVEFKPWYAV